MIGRRQFVVGAVLAGTTLTGAGGALLATSDGSDGAPAPSDTEDSAVVSAGSELAVVGRGDISEAKDFNGTLNYGASADLPIAANGIVTNRPDAGTVVEPGQELIRLDNAPVYLAEGDLPMYRTLRKTPDVKLKGEKYMIGFDVGQLQIFLMQAGFDGDGKLTEADGRFGPTTEKAVKAWQKSVGLRQSGEVDRTQLIFMPHAVRIDTTHQLGVEFTELPATSSEQSVSFGLSSRDRRLVAVGDTVAVVAGDVSTTGTITRVERTTTGDGGSGLQASMTLADDLPVDAGSPKVTITEIRATDVLTVPVRALLAVSEGGFAVELPNGQLVRVEVGDVANGVAEIAGDVTVGDQVVVPT